MNISTTGGLQGRLANFTRLYGRNKSFATKLDTVQDMVDIKGEPQEDQFEAWIDYALDQPAKWKMALDTSQEELPLTWGQ